MFNEEIHNNKYQKNVNRMSKLVETMFVFINIHELKKKWTRVASPDNGGPNYRGSTVARRSLLPGD